MEEHRLVQKGYRFVNKVENYAKSADSSMCMEGFIDIRKDLKDIQEIYPFYKSKGGIPFFYSNNTAYVDASDAHNLVIGSTGSKKTRLVVMPSVKILAYAEESMIIADPKAEVYERTAFELKEQGYKIYVINFRSPEEGDCWNPLEIPFHFFKKGKLDKAREHANDVAVNLALSEIGHNDPYWDRSAYNLLFGLIQLAFIIGKENDSVSMNDVLQLRAAIFLHDNKINPKYLEIIQKDQIVYHSLLGTINAPENTRDSILSVFDQKVSCFSYQEDLKKMMASNSIDLNDFGNKKTAVFLIMPDEKTTYHQLVSLFIKQSYEYFVYYVQQLDEHCFSIRINYILDEFSNLPAIKDFPAMISAARSRNIRFSLIVQSLQQLTSKYKSDADIIKGNCTNLVFLNSRELNVLEEVSTLCGTTENNERLFSVFGLQHLDKEKGQAIILSGRLFPFVTELMDIDQFDGGMYKHLPIKKRVPINKSKKSITYDFEQKIENSEQKEKGLKLSDIKHKNVELKQKEEYLIKLRREFDQLNDYTNLRGKKARFHTYFCHYGAFIFSLIAIVKMLCGRILLVDCWLNNSIISINILLIGILLIYLVCILSIRSGIGKIILLGTPIIIEIFRIVFFGKNLYILENAFYMILIYYISAVIPYADEYEIAWKLRKSDIAMMTISSILLLVIGIYVSFSAKTWYANINGIIVLGMLIVTIVYRILKLASSLNYFDGDVENILVVCMVIISGIYFLLTFVEFIILSYFGIGGNLNE